MSSKSIEEQKQVARNTNELLDHLVKIIEQNDDRFSFEWATGGEKIVMEIFDKEKEIGYAVKIEPIEYDENGEALNLQIKNESFMNSYMTYKLDIHSIYKTERGNNYDYTQNYYK